MRPAILTLALIALLAVLPAHAQVCTGFSHDLSLAGADGTVICTVVHDDGTGPALYAGGMFNTIGGIVSPGIARWNGTSWTAINGELGVLNGVLPGPHCLLSYHGRLYAGGRFHVNGSPQESHFVVWDGTHWTVVPGSPDGPVTALSEYHGTMLVGGDFVLAGGITCNKVAQYDPSTSQWSSLGTGLLGGSVYCFATYMEPSGERLFAGGSELTLPGNSIKAIASWDGSAWSIPGGGMSNYCGDLTVNTMMVFDPGTGPKLLVGGEFFYAGGPSTAGGILSPDLALWDGSSWSPLGTFGVNFNVCSGYNVSALQIHDDGSGPALYIGGWFPSIDGVPGPNLMRYRSGVYETLPSAPNAGIFNLIEFQSELIAGGTQNSAAGIRTENIGRWDGSSWHPLGDGRSPGYAKVLCIHDDGTGPTLYGVIEGHYGETDHTPVLPVQRLTNGIWTPLNQPVGDYQLLALLSADDGSGAGPSLFVGGLFPLGSSSYQGVQRWNAGGWTPLGPSSISGYVRALAEFDEGAGSRIFAGGNFTDIGGVPAHGVARWNGLSWTDIGAGLTPQTPVKAMCVFDDGTGPALYVAGSFSQIGGISANSIARWDGTTWSALGGGISYDIMTMTVHDDGTGPALYVGGSIVSAGGTPAANVAQWKNGAWAPLGPGLIPGYVNGLEWFNDGTGPALYATGSFNYSDGPYLHSLARWNGVHWEAVGAGLGLAPYAYSAYQYPAIGRCLKVHTDAGLSSLWIGGTFGTIDGVVSNGIARLCSNSLVNAGFCFGDGSGTSCPCGNDAALGSGSGCTSTLGIGAVMSAQGVPSLSHDSVLLHGDSMPNSFVLYFQGTTQTAGGAGSVFGDGLRCASGSVVRLGAALNIAGQSHYPSTGNATVSAKGLVMTPGARTYQAWYRNAAQFCTPSTFNLTNGIAVNWQP